MPQTKTVLRLMSQAKPRAKPDAVSYGYLITCFAESRKPRSALTVFHQVLPYCHVHLFICHVARCCVVSVSNGPDCIHLCFLTLHGADPSLLV